MIKKKIWFVVLLCFTLIAAGCTSNENTKENTPEENKQADVLDKEFEQILEDAKGTTVGFYGYGGDQKINAWVDYDLSRLF